MNRKLRIALPAAAAALAAGALLAPTALATPNHSGTAVASQASNREWTNERAAIGVLNIAFNEHDPKKAAEKYISAYTYIQHNPNIGNGRDAFVAGITGYVKQYPDISLDFKRTIAQDNLVVVESLSKINAADRGTVEVDTFRFDLNGKIVEHWDALQPVAAQSANGNPQV
ncbi:nuclear transport factor 2 family protein [Streptomyces mirabilis]|uniref:nuclear transport factor 2 family protein n=1 Tax=Streptomyces mirabilis TaxID=68239 RepID=UPI0033185566